MQPAPYDPQFFADNQANSQLAAQIILPTVQAMIAPRSVVDVGCGLGSWLAVWQTLGVNDIVGMDGAYIPSHDLVIPQECFVPVELNQPFALPRRFDLAMSLEVAEHLASEFAPAFVQSLTHLAPVVLFSAAIPLQGGVGHINEQWPEYWVALFAAQGYQVVDALRRRFWNDRRIEFWYRQNLLIFCTDEVLQHNAALAEAYKQTSPTMLSVVHPEHYLENVIPGIRHGELPEGSVPW